MTFELQPTFSVSLRGYDRDQVDMYTAQLRQQLLEAQQNASDTASPSADRDGAEPAAVTDFDALGERIAAILRLAEEEASDRRSRAQQEAEAIVAGAREEADEIRRTATVDVEQLRESKLNATREAKSVLENARDQAEDLLGRARRHAEDQAEGIIAQAESDAGRILEEAREAAQARLEDGETRRTQLAAETEALEQRHRRVLADLARVRAALDADAIPAQPDEEQEAHAQEGAVPQ
jgi:cell division septum initiation protein DivIVA